MMIAPVRITSDVDAAARVSREIVGWLFDPPLGTASLLCCVGRGHSGGCCSPTNLALGEAYLRDDFDVEGDIEAAKGLASQISSASTLRTRDTPTFAPTEKPRLDVGE